MKVDIYNQKGEKTGGIELPKNVFGLVWNDVLVHQVVTSMQSNKRVPVAHAKGRGEVSGTGKKPWAQKGTGRARHGSRRSPIWVGGGVAHGPTKEKKFSKKINKKMKKKAFLTVLSQKLKDKEILFLDKINLDQIKTKEAAKILKDIAAIKGFGNLSGKGKKKSILILPQGDKDVTRCFHNLPLMKISEARNLNALDLLYYKYLIITQPEQSIAFWQERGGKD